MDRERFKRWTHSTIAESLPGWGWGTGGICVNSGRAKPAFTPEVIRRGRPGWHDAVLGEIDGDGAIDIASKVWNTDWNADGHNYHVDYWRGDVNRGRQGCPGHPGARACPGWGPGYLGDIFPQMPLTSAARAFTIYLT